MRNLDRIINESINEQVNRIMLREDIDRQNALCEQVLIDEGLVNGIKSMWNGLKAIGNQFKNAYAYGNEVANAQDEMKKVKNANEVIQDMAKKGIINNTIQSNWNEVLQNTCNICKTLQILNIMVELITETHVKHHMRKWQKQTTQRK